MWECGKLIRTIFDNLNIGMIEVITHANKVPGAVLSATLDYGSICNCSHLIG